MSTNDLIYQPEFVPYVNASNTTGIFTVCPLSTPMTSNPLFMSSTLINCILQPTNSVQIQK